MTSALVDDDLLTVMPDWTARDWAMAGLDVPVRLMWFYYGNEKLRSLAYLLVYADKHHGRGGKKRVPVDVEKMVELWMETLVPMVVAHDHEAHSQAEARTDELLGPILTAPLADLRAFASQLAARLEGDPRVPFLVWSAFRRIIEPLILAREAGEPIRLKTALAQEVAELVEKDLPRADLIAAIAGALQWRGQETLEKVKSEIGKGAKPRLKGRESCLFVTAVAEDGTHLAEVLL